MVNCPECGKELKHKGALSGHLAFAHGIVNPKQLTMDELREEVKKLRSALNSLFSTYASRRSQLCPSFASST